MRFNKQNVLVALQDRADRIADREKFDTGNGTSQLKPKSAMADEDIRRAVEYGRMMAYEEFAQAIHDGFCFEFADAMRSKESSKMNCKPGDLAVIVRARVQENVGLLVTVLNEWEQSPEGFCWRTKTSHPVPVLWVSDLTDAGLSNTFFTPDAWLRPIRDPGEDAKDETLLWLPVPEREVA